MQHLKRAEPVTNSLYIQRHEPYICNITDTFYNHSITNSICMQHLKRAAIHSSRAEPLGIVPRVNDFPPRSSGLMRAALAEYLSIQELRTLYMCNTHEPYIDSTSPTLFLDWRKQRWHSTCRYRSHTLSTFTAPTNHV